MMRVLITRPRKDAAEFARILGEAGVEAIFLPTIEIHPMVDNTPLDQALTKLDEFDWLILTSANSVDAVLGRKAALGMDCFPESLRIAAIGPKTAGRLLESGVTPDFVPDDYLAEAILPGLGDLNGRRVLLPLADIAHDTLPHAIREANGMAHVVTAYHTLPTEPNPGALAALDDGLDVITFTSGSTASNFVRLVELAGLDPFNLPGSPKIACIGPKTARRARELGFTVDIVATSHTVDGLVQAILSYFRGKPPHDAD